MSSPNRSKTADDLEWMLRKVDPSGTWAGFHVAMSADTYRVLQRQYAVESRPQIASLWDGLIICIDHHCAFGVVEHRKGWKP